MNFFPSFMELLYLFPAILISLTFHEFAHGYISYRLGDPTPIHDGRLSLNPLRHLDPIGAIMLILFKFGWAKPVMINPGYYKNPKKGMALVAIAGPLANFLLALICLIIFVSIFRLTNGIIPTSFTVPITFLKIMSLINVGLGVFNLIPVPPLDGSKVLAAFLSDKAYFKYTQLSGYGFLIVLFLIYFGFFNGPLVTIREYIMDLLQYIAIKITFFIPTGPEVLV